MLQTAMAVSRTAMAAPGIRETRDHRMYIYILLHTIFLPFFSSFGFLYLEPPIDWVLHPRSHPLSIIDWVRDSRLGIGSGFNRPRVLSLGILAL